MWRHRVSAPVPEGGGHDHERVAERLELVVGGQRPHPIVEARVEPQRLVGAPLRGSATAALDNELNCAEHRAPSPPSRAAERCPRRPRSSCSARRHTNKRPTNLVGALLLPRVGVRVLWHGPIAKLRSSPLLHLCRLLCQLALLELEQAHALGIHQLLHAFLHAYPLQAGAARS